MALPPKGKAVTSGLKTTRFEVARPAYKPSLDEIRKVEVLVAAGWGERDIAEVLEIARETLRKHFRRELQNGSLTCRAEVLQSLHFSARSYGNISAKKMWLDLMAAAAPKRSEPKQEPAPEPLRLVAGER